MAHTTKSTYKFQCWIRHDQREWLQNLTPEQLAAPFRAKDLAPDRLQSEVVRLALDIVMRNPKLLEIIPLGREHEITGAVLARLRRELAATPSQQRWLSLVAGLPEPELQVAQLHLGVEDGRPLTFAEIGDRLGFSRQRAHQIWNHARGLMRKLAKGEPLEPSAPRPVGLGGFVDLPAARAGDQR